eukprot:5508200-Alexandrium_andersonii.AAC.1
MSASLVGSEMCIRDSQTAVRETRAATAGGARDTRTFRLPNPRLAGRFSVSYTHLTLPTICSV